MTTNGLNMVYPGCGKYVLAVFDLVNIPSFILYSDSNDDTVVGIGIV